MEGFLDVRSTPKLSSALLLTAVFVHVTGYSSTHWSDGGVFYTGLWRACFLTPHPRCLRDPYSAGESAPQQVGGSYYFVVLRVVTCSPRRILMHSPDKVILRVNYIYVSGVTEIEILR